MGHAWGLATDDHRRDGVEELVDQPEREHLAREAGTALEQCHLAVQVRRDGGQVDETAGSRPQFG